MGKAKKRKENGQYPDQDGRSAADREFDAAVEAAMQQEVQPYPVPVSWKLLRMKDPVTDERKLVLVMQTPVGPFHCFFAPEDFYKFAEYINGAAEADKEESTGLSVVKNGIVVPGADQPL